MRQSELDDRDRAILRELMRDGRIANVELAERVHLSASACLRRVRALEERGLIAGYVMLLDAAKLGLRGRRLRLRHPRPAGPRDARRLRGDVRRHPEIIGVLPAGRLGRLSAARSPSATPRDFERIHTEILTQLPGVSRVQSTLALRTVKSTTALPI